MLNSRTSVKPLIMGYTKPSTRKIEEHQPVNYNDFTQTGWSALGARTTSYREWTKKGLVTKQDKKVDDRKLG